MHVGDDRPLRFEAVDPAQGIVHAEMTGVAVVAEPIDNPQLEIFQRRPTLAWNVTEIGRVGGVADAVAQGGDLAVRRREGDRGPGAPFPSDARDSAGSTGRRAGVRGLAPPGRGSKP